ncbi:MAG: hypothetical protein LBK59_08500 [Bifidobacteriaceae bacterium]|nr:hypothetical protein [Bifidobacteriaceae bacterium]
MFQLTDESVRAGVDVIAGFLVAQAAAESGRSVEDVTEAFYASDAYAQLADPQTGRYWDSLPELLDLFLTELASS